MKILFDPQVFSLGYSGMLRYYSALFEGLKDAGVKIVHPEESPFKQEPGEPSFWESALHPKIQRIADRYKFHRIKSGYYKAISKDNFDLLYITAPNFETDFLKHLREKPFAMTVHDTMKVLSGHHTFFDQPGDTSSLGYLAHHAARVICVSNYTKEDLCTKYDVNRDKTQTVYLANFLSSGSIEVPGLPESYILFVGSRNGRKNFFEWLKAVAPYLSNRPDVKVVVTEPLTDIEKFFSQKFGVLENMVSLENVTDARLNTLYQNALCLVYPSLYEGFGLPVVEAMANGCPVIASNCTSIPEVAGAAAVLIDPNNPEMMLNSLKKVVENDELRTDLTKKGWVQSEKFSRDRFIREMVAQFEEAIRSYQR